MIVRRKVEGLLPIQQLVIKNPHRVHVNLSGDESLFHHSLWREARERAKPNILKLDLCFSLLQFLRDSEINYLKGVLMEDDVLRLQIVVDHPIIMEILYPIQNLPEQFLSLRFLHTPQMLNVVGKFGALIQLKCIVKVITVLDCELLSCHTDVLMQQTLLDLELLDHQLREDTKLLWLTVLGRH